MMADDLTINHPFLKRGMALAADWVQPLATDRCLGITTSCTAAIETLLTCCIAAVAIVCTGKPTHIRQAMSA